MLTLAVTLAGCAVAGRTPVAVSPTSSPDATSAARTATPPPTAVPSPSPGATNIDDVPNFAPLDRATYYIDLPGGDASTTQRVFWDIAAEGWMQWIGAFKPEADWDRHVGLTIATFTSVVVDGCLDHQVMSPSMGPTVDDLTTALSRLKPYEVAEPATDITRYGYKGRALTLSSPPLPFETRGDDTFYTECEDGQCCQ